MRKFAIVWQFVTGRFAASNNLVGNPEFPPHPDRVFQAALSALLSGQDNTAPADKQGLIHALEEMLGGTSLIFAGCETGTKITSALAPPDATREGLEPWVQSCSIFARNTWDTADKSAKSLMKSAFGIPPNAWFCYCGALPEGLSDTDLEALRSLFRSVNHLGQRSSMVRADLLWTEAGLDWEDGVGGICQTMAIGRGGERITLFPILAINPAKTGLYRVPIKGRGRHLILNTEFSSQGRHLDGEGRYARTKWCAMGPIHEVIGFDMMSEFQWMLPIAVRTNGGLLEFQDALRPMFRKAVNETFQTLVDDGRAQTLEKEGLGWLHRWAMGHAPTGDERAEKGTMAQETHLGIVPILNVGPRKFADGRLLGIGLIGGGYGGKRPDEVREITQELLAEEPLRGLADPDDLRLDTLSNLREASWCKAGTCREWATVTPYVWPMLPKSMQAAMDGKGKLGKCTSAWEATRRQFEGKVPFAVLARLSVLESLRATLEARDQNAPVEEIFHWLWKDPDFKVTAQSTADLSGAPPVPDLVKMGIGIRHQGKLRLKGDFMSYLWIELPPWFRIHGLLVLGSGRYQGLGLLRPM